MEAPSTSLTSIADLLDQIANEHRHVRASRRPPSWYFWYSKIVYGKLNRPIVNHWLHLIMLVQVLFFGISLANRTSWETVVGCSIIWVTFTGLLIYTDFLGLTDHVSAPRVLIALLLSPLVSIVQIVNACLVRRYQSYVFDESWLNDDDCFQDRPPSKIVHAYLERRLDACVAIIDEKGPFGVIAKHLELLMTQAESVEKRLRVMQQTSVDDDERATLLDQLLTQQSTWICRVQAIGSMHMKAWRLMKENWIPILKQSRDVAVASARDLEELKNLVVGHERDVSSPMTNMGKRADQRFAVASKLFYVVEDRIINPIENWSRSGFKDIVLLVHDIVMYEGILRAIPSLPEASCQRSAESQE